METLVITDLDGSFWGRDLRCHPKTLAAVTVLREAGIPLLVATGRRENSARRGLEANGLSLPAVLLNGTLGVDLRTDSRFHSMPFAPKDAESVVESLASVNVSPVVYTDDGRVRGGRDVSTGPDHRRSFGTDFVVEDPFATVRSRAVLSFSMIGMDRARIEPAVIALEGVRADALMYEDHLYQAWSLHIQPAAVSKLNGIQSYLEYSGLNPKRVVAIGDGNNDLEMLDYADIAFGVEGGHEEVMSMVDHTLPNPDEGGWAQLLDYL